MLQDLLEGAGRSIVFGLVGIGLMALGYVLIDLLTPGKLRDLAVFLAIVGIAIMGRAFLVLDWMTPGKLGEVICTPERHGGAMVSAAAHFGAALIICACIA